MWHSCCCNYNVLIIFHNSLVMFWQWTLTFQWHQTQEPLQESQNYTWCRWNEKRCVHIHLPVFGKWGTFWPDHCRFRHMSFPIIYNRQENWAHNLHRATNSIIVEFGDPHWYRPRLSECASMKIFDLLVCNHLSTDVLERYQFACSTNSSADCALTHTHGSYLLISAQLLSLFLL